MTYHEYFGGVTAFRALDFININGHSNNYWGWGGEDDDLYLRVKRKLNTTISRYSTQIARYTTIRDHNHIAAPKNPKRFNILHSKPNYDSDGINTVKYLLHNRTFYKLFILLNVTLV